MAVNMDLLDSLPENGGGLVGRVWNPRGVPGPAVVTLVGGEVLDLTPRIPTMSDLLEQEDPTPLASNTDGLTQICTTDELLRNSAEGNGNSERPYMLSPIELQAIKACGVTFVASLVERVIEGRIEYTDKIAPWAFGIRELFRNLAARGLNEDILIRTEA